jgi:hypothetical protein
MGYFPSFLGSTPRYLPLATAHHLRHIRSPYKQPYVKAVTSSFTVPPVSRLLQRVCMSAMRLPSVRRTCPQSSENSP